jgi:hypothetical protein
MNFSNKIFHVHSVVRRLTVGPTGHFSKLPGIQTRNLLISVQNSVLLEKLLPP